MHSFYLDTYQRKVEAAIQKAGSIVVSGQKMSGKTFLLTEVCSRAVRDGKKVLLVVHDEHQAMLLQKKLGKFLTGDQVLYFETEALHQDQIHKVLVRIKTPDTSFAEKDLIAKKSLIAQLNSAIRYYYEGLNRQLLFGKPWHELLVLNAFDRHFMETLHFNPLFRIRDLRFDQAEFDRMSAIILTAKDFHERSEAHIDLFFRSELYSSESGIQAWTRIMDWVSNMRKSCVNKLIAVGLYINQRIDTRISHALTLVDEAHALLNMLKVHTELYIEEKDRHRSPVSAKRFFQKAEPGSAIPEVLPESLKGAYQQVMDAFAKVPGFSNFAERKNKDTEVMTLDQLLFLTSEFDQFLGSFPSIIRESVQKETGKLNIQATDDPVLAKLSDELEAFYTEIQEEKILSKTIEPAAFNLDKHLGQLQSILRQLSDVSGLGDHFVKCFAFNKFYHSLAPAEQLLVQNMLELSPKDWGLFFKNWFIQNAIQQYGNFFHRIKDSELRASIKIENEIRQLAQTRQVSLSEPDRKQWLQKLETKNKRLYQQIFNKNQLTGQDWKELVAQFPEFLQLLFPAIITTTTVLKKLSPTFASGFDFILVDLADHGYVEFVSDAGEIVKTPAKKIFTVEDVDEPVEKLVRTFQPPAQIMELHGYHQQSLMPLSDMNHTERLYGARNLAHLIRDVAPGVEIFKLGDKILYSCLSEPLNQLLLAILDHKGIKKMRVLETPFNLLLENLLEIHSKQLLLIQDGLLNSTSWENLSWQLYVRDQAVKAGLTLINLDTLDLRVAPVKVFREFIETNISGS